MKIAGVAKAVNNPGGGVGRGLWHLATRFPACFPACKRTGRTSFPPREATALPRQIAAISCCALRAHDASQALDSRAQLFAST